MTERRGGLFEFERGTRLGTVFAIQPKSWRIEATMDLRQDDRLTVEWAIHTTGQLVAPAETQYFDALLHEIRAALEAEVGDVPARALARRGEEAASYNASALVLNAAAVAVMGLGWVLIPILLVAVFSIPAYIAIPAGFAFGTALGLAGALSYRHRSRRLLPPASGNADS